MRVRFNYTQEDMVDGSMRFLGRSKTIRRTRWQGMAMTALLSWLLMFAVFFRQPLVGALLGICTAGVSALLYPAVHKNAVTKRMRKYIREKYGEVNSFVCEVELTPNGFLT